MNGKKILRSVLFGASLMLSSCSGLSEAFGSQDIPNEEEEAKLQEKIGGDWYSDCILLDEDKYQQITLSFDDYEFMDKKILTYSDSLCSTMGTYQEETSYTYFSELDSSIFTIYDTDDDDVPDTLLEYSLSDSLDTLIIYEDTGAITYHR
jgi:hypothetical protein